MRSAPPVLVPVGRFVWGANLAAALAAGTALVCSLAAAWYGIRAILMGGVWVLTAGTAWWFLRRELLPPGELSWDGQSWWYRADGDAAVAVTLALQWDAGQAMLLRLDGRGVGGLLLPRHAWLKASQMPAQWHGLRCAVHVRDIL